MPTSPQPVEFFRVSKTITFTGAAGAGAVGTSTLFQVDGAVFVAVSIEALTSLDDAGETAVLRMGTASNEGIFGGADPAIGAVAGNSLTSGGVFTAPESRDWYRIHEDIILVVANEAITSGAIEITVLYGKHSADGAVTAA